MFFPLNLVAKKNVTESDKLDHGCLMED